MPKRNILEVSPRELRDLAWERGHPATKGQVMDACEKPGILVSKIRGLQLWLVDEFPAEFKLGRGAS